MTLCGIATRSHPVVAVSCCPSPFRPMIAESSRPANRDRSRYVFVSHSNHTASPMTSGESFYGGIPVFRGFTSLMDPALYAPLPDDWSIGVADIVDSTKAIAAQRYKAVNMAGAAVIAAVTNA